MRLQEACNSSAHQQKHQAELAGHASDHLTAPTQSGLEETSAQPGRICVLNVGLKVMWTEHVPNVLIVQSGDTKVAKVKDARKISL